MAMGDQLMNQQKRYFENSIDQQHSSFNHHQSHQQQNYHHYQQLSNQSISNTHQYSTSLPPNYSTAIIKTEPPSNYPNYHTMETMRDNPMLTSAMPIPRTGKLINSEFNFDFDQSPQITQDGSFAASPSSFGQQTSNNSNTMWSIIGDAMTLSKTEPFTMDEDDIFQVDKADLLQGPTLAELNDDTILEDLNFEDFMLPADSSSLLLLNNASNSQQFNETSTPPQQLLQIQNQSANHQSHTQTSSDQHSQNTAQLLGQSISIGRDALLYDEQTNISSSPFDIYQSPAPRSVNSSVAFSPSSQTSSGSPLLVNSISPPPYTMNNNTMNMKNNNTIKDSTFLNNNNNESITRNKQYTTLQELLKQEPPMSPEHNEYGQSVPGPSNMSNVMRNRYESSQNRRMLFAHQHSAGSSNSRLSSSAPTNSSAVWETHQIWQRREPRQHLLSTGSLAEAGSTSSLSTGGILSPEANDFSHDEGYEDSDSDHYEDFSSDNDSDNEDAPTRGSGSKKERYFWQYNVQAKGPKGQRLVIKTNVEDPHFLNEVTDPVFSPSCSVRGIKHSGKARKGDGNDLTPNPKKLNNIGKELDKLGRTINDMTPVSELPFNVRPKSRKEKNKLASRACRLKKKAQHEANKIKLFGLETEHKRLINGIEEVKRVLAYKYSHPDENTEEANQKIDDFVEKATTFKIAGISTEFVNKVLEKVKSGVPGGGLNEI